MRKESTESRSESRPEWEQLEDWVRSQVQRLIQELLEEEVTAFLGRAKSALRSDSDNDTGYRNGYGRARRLTLSSGTIQLRRPRVRDTEEQFESRLLPLFVNRTRKVAELIPELYLHGLSEGDFDLALRGLLGEDAPVSASTVARLKSKWNDELAQWRSRPLDDLEVVYPELPISNRLGPSKVPSSTRAIVVSLVNAVNHSIERTNRYFPYWESSGSMGSPNEMVAS